MLRTVQIAIASSSGCASGAALASAALFVLGAALAASPAVADQTYPPGLFENSPVVPNGQPTGEPAPAQPSGPNGPAANAAPPGYDAPPAPGYDAPPAAGYDAPPAPGYGGPPPGYGGPVVPRGYEAPPGYIPAPGRPETYAPQTDFCAGVATRVFGSLEELRRAHARCDRAYAAPPPPGYPPAY